MVKIVIPSIVCEGKGLEITKQVAGKTVVATYNGIRYVNTDPNLPSDNTYQIGIPGTNFVIDASKTRVGRGHFINECWDPAKANCKFIVNPDDREGYMLVQTLKKANEGEELLTTYGKDYWSRKLQWARVGRAGKDLARTWYKIKDSDIFLVIL